MMTMNLLATWSVVAILATLSPGPDLLIVTTSAARHGTRAGLAAAAGIAVGGVWYAALCGFGFLSLLNASPLLYLIARSVGAAYLAWLGLRLLAGAVRPAPDVVGGPLTSGAPFRQGLLTNIFNPKVAVFYLAILPQFVGIGPDAPLLGVALIGIHYAIAAVWFSVIAVVAGRAGHRVVRSPVVRWVEGVLGAAFVGFAGRLAISRP